MATTLTISYDELNEHPDQAQAVEELTLEDLPEDADFRALRALPGLKRLSLATKDLAALVRALATAVPHLQGLSIEVGKLGEVPEEIGEFSALTSLELKGFLGGLPRSFTRLESLRHLALGAFRYKHVPEEVFALTGLRSLRLKAVNALPAAIGALGALETLSLGWVNQLPPELSRLKSLRELSLAGALRHPRFPRVIGELHLLECLDLSQAEVSETEWLRPFSRLRKLNLGETDVRSLTDIGALSTLTDLDLTALRLMDLSPLANLKALERLVLDYARIRDLEVVSRLPSLRTLSLSNLAADSIAGLFSLGEVEVSADDSVAEKYERRVELREKLPGFRMQDLRSELASERPAVVEDALDRLVNWSALVASDGGNPVFAALGLRDTDGTEATGTPLPSIDEALDRHSAQLSSALLVRVFESLFRDPESDDFLAAARIAREVIGRDEATQLELVSVILKRAQGRQFYAPDRTSTTYQVVASSVLPRYSGTAVTPLLTEFNVETAGIAHLFVPALAALDTASGDDTLLRALEKYLDAKKKPESEVWAMLDAVPAGATRRALDLLRAERLFRAGVEERLAATIEETARVLCQASVRLDPSLLQQALAVPGLQLATLIDLATLVELSQPDAEAHSTLRTALLAAGTQLGREAVRALVGKLGLKNAAAAELLRRAAVEVVGELIEASLNESDEDEADEDEARAARPLRLHSATPPLAALRAAANELDGATELEGLAREARLGLKHARPPAAIEYIHLTLPCEQTEETWLEFAWGFATRPYDRSSRAHYLVLARDLDAVPSLTGLARDRVLLALGSFLAEAKDAAGLAALSELTPNTPGWALDLVTGLVCQSFVAPPEGRADVAHLWGAVPEMDGMSEAEAAGRQINAVIRRLAAEHPHSYIAPTVAYLEARGSTEATLEADLVARLDEDVGRWISRPDAWDDIEALASSVLDVLPPGEATDRVLARVLQVCLARDSHRTWQAVAALKDTDALLRVVRRALEQGVPPSSFIEATAFEDQRQLPEFVELLGSFKDSSMPHPATG